MLIPLSKTLHAGRWLTALVLLCGLGAPLSAQAGRAGTTAEGDPGTAARLRIAALLETQRLRQALDEYDGYGKASGKPEMPLLVPTARAELARSTQPPAGDPVAVSDRLDRL